MYTRDKLGNRTGGLLAFPTQSNKFWTRHPWRGGGGFKQVCALSIQHWFSNFWSWFQNWWNLKCPIYFLGTSLSEVLSCLSLALQRSQIFGDRWYHLLVLSSTQSTTESAKEYFSTKVVKLVRAAKVQTVCVFLYLHWMRSSLKCENSWDRRNKKVLLTWFICMYTRKFLHMSQISVTAHHRLAYTHKLAETLDSQLVHYITTKCVLYMQLLQIK